MAFQVVFDRIMGEGMLKLQITCLCTDNVARGEDRSLLASVHNSRIERDVFGSCIILYYNIFYHMEEMRLLDVDNELHIFCLHYVFLPKINASLQSFKEAWNSYPMQSESGLSPD